MSSKATATATASASGIGFGGLLTIAFIVLKLCKVIDWSWIWVLSPLWISVALVFAILAIVGVFVIIRLAISKATKKRKW